MEHSACISIFRNSKQEMYVYVVCVCVYTYMHTCVHALCVMGSSRKMHLKVTMVAWRTGVGRLSFYTFPLHAFSFYTTLYVPYSKQMK